MILDHKSGLCGVLVDADTNERIPFARWANTDTGEYRALVATQDRQAIAQPAQEYRGQCRRLRFIEDPVRTACKQARPKPARPPVPEAVQRRAALHGAVCQDRAECETPGCHRRADWLTGDEQEIEPETGSDGRRYERGVVIQAHRYCARCYRPPTSTNLRGVERELQVAARPQW